VCVGYGRVCVCRFVLVVVGAPGLESLRMQGIPFEHIVISVDNAFLIV